MTETLKPCPFTREKPKHGLTKGTRDMHGDLNQNYQVWTKYCRVTASDKERAFEIWNQQADTRATPSREDVAETVYQAMIWAAQQSPPPNGAAYPSWQNGNSGAETEARRTADAILALTPSDVADPQNGWRRVKHIKRGSTYQVIAEGMIQSDRPLKDYDNIVVYRGESDGMVWVRPLNEFEDPDRFEELPPTPHPATDEAAVQEAARVPMVSRSFAEGLIKDIEAAQGKYDAESENAHLLFDARKTIEALLRALSQEPKS